MKNAYKLMLMMVIFIGTAQADGDMGSGGRACHPNCPPPNPFTQTQNGSATKNEKPQVNKNINEQTTRIFVEVLWFLQRIF